MVYQQLSKEEKSDATQIKEVLITAFVTDSFTMYEKFKACVLHLGETVDIYLVNLQKLVVLFGRILDHACLCADFLAQ